MLIIKISIRTNCIHLFVRNFQQLLFVIIDVFVIIIHCIGDGYKNYTKFDLIISGVHQSKKAQFL